jgi:hypothetical protein
MRVRFPIAFVLSSVLAAAGCSDGPNIVKVSGTAYYKGEPVPNLRVTFQPDKGRPSWGDTDANGRFTLEYDAQNKGALVGRHTVSAVVNLTNPDDEMKMVNEGPRSKIGASARAVASKYGDTIASPMKVEITGTTDNIELKFD